MLFSAFSLIQEGCELVSVHLASVAEGLLDRMTWRFDALHLDACADRCIFHGADGCVLSWIAWTGSAVDLGSAIFPGAFASKVCPFLANCSIAERAHAVFSAASVFLDS